MRVSRVHRVASQAFHPHVHRRDCHICCGVQKPSESTACTGTTATNVRSVRSSPSAQSSVSAPSVSASTSTPAVDQNVDVSTMQRREDAFIKWSSLFRTPGTNTSAGDGRRKNAVTSFLDPNVAFSEQRLTEAIDYLNTLCSRACASPTGKGENPTVEEPAEASQVLIPLPSSISFATPQHGETAELPPKLFNSFTKAVGLLPENQRGKQYAFQRALLDFKHVLDTRTRLRFFLACGTALAAHRDGCFIPHDDDIDVGVFVDDLIVIGRQHMTKSLACTRQYVQAGVLRLLSDLCSDSALFVLFDVCGDLLRGLELRFLHQPTKVKLDLNVYYPPILPEDEALVATGGHFVWHASFYEEASQRRFGMYRFKQAPFAGSLLNCRFCDESTGSDGEPQRTSNGFLVPPEQYLDDYFGPDWHSPRAFTYTEGLDHEYKNIIPE